MTTTNSLPEFCDKHNILWFPIALTIDGSTKTLESISHPLYNGRPKMTDFKELSFETIKKRQALLTDAKWSQILNVIAMDTTNVKHIDIDTPNYDEGFDKIMEITPYFKSLTKAYGRHAFITFDDFEPTSKRMQFKCEGVELLVGQWSYAPLTLCNADKPILQLTNIAEMLVTNKSKSKPLKEIKSNVQDANVIIEDDNDTDIESYSSVIVDDNEYEKLLKCIGHSMCKSGQHTQWINVGQALKNELKNEANKYFINWTNDFGSPNKKKEAYDYITKHIKYVAKLDKKRLTKASLHYWAKENDKDLYNELFPKPVVNVSNEDDELETVIASGTEYDIAVYLNKLCGNKFVCIDVNKKGSYYCFNDNNLWELDEGGTPIRQFISNELYNKLNDYIVVLKSIEASTEEVRVLLDKKIKVVGEIAIRLKKTGDKDHILREFADITKNTSFGNDMNKAKYLLPVLNKKIFNMKTLAIEDRTIEHKFSYECDANFKEINEDEFADINQYFLDLFCGKQDTVDCVIDILKSIFSGDTLRYIFFFTGKGMNGKSLLFKILSQIFKGAMDTIATNVILDLKMNNQITTEFEKLDKCRLGYITELKDDDKLNETTIKKISGGDPIDLRALFKTNATINPTANLGVLTNVLPRFKKEKAIVDRIIVIPFLNTFEVDSEFETKMLLKKDLIFSYIMSKGTIRDKFNLTEEMITAKNDYVDENDVDYLKTFINETYERVKFVKTEKVVNNVFAENYLLWLQKYKINDNKTNVKQITKRMKEYDISTKESHGKTYYLGLVEKIEEDIDDSL